jgi:hypothetical protein
MIAVLQEAARDVMPGQSWAFRQHRSMAEVLKDESASKAREILGRRPAASVSSLSNGAVI